MVFVVYILPGNSVRISTKLHTRKIKVEVALTYVKILRSFVEKSMKPLLEFKTNRFFFLIPLPIIAMLVTVFYWAVFISDPPVFDDDMVGTIIFCVLMVLGLFLFVIFIRRFISDKPDFILYDEGFISNTNGVDLGLMRWSDVKSIKEESVQTGNEVSRVMVVTFHDPEYYSTRVSKAMKLGRGGGRVLSFLQQFRPGNNQSTDLPMYIDPGVFGKRYPQVLLLSEELVRKHQRQHS